MPADPLTKPGDIIHVAEGRAVECIDAELADWPTVEDDGGTVRFVRILTRPTRIEPLRKGDPRIGINERILASVAAAKRRAA
jgi:hypothetical protein